MVSELARGDYDDMVADGLKPTLYDFDRLNLLALRLTDGAETTAANFPRIGWAGDIPFHQPTCAAFAWYLEHVHRADFDAATKDACWFFALAHARDDGAFAGLNDGERRPLFSRLFGRSKIKKAVNAWLASLPVTREEIARACRYAAVGFDDAEPGKTDAAKERDAAKSDEERREASLAGLSATVETAAALTGIAPGALTGETPSRLARMVDAVRMNNPMGGGMVRDRSGAHAAYDLALREIRRRLTAERDAEKETATNGKQDD